jgi:hypothetical protein
MAFPFLPMFRRPVKPLAAAGGGGTPLNTELNPDPELQAGAVDWTKTGGTVFNSDSISFVGTSLISLGGTLPANNTTGANLTAGTYRFVLLISNFSGAPVNVRATVGTVLTTQLGPDSSPMFYVIDVVVPTDQTTGLFGFRTLAAGSSFDIESMSVQRIA